MKTITIIASLLIGPLLTLAAVGPAGSAETPPNLTYTSKDVVQSGSGEKYPDQKGMDIVTDAPWFVIARANLWIPVLLFVPDSRSDDQGTVFDKNHFRGLRFKRVTIYANEKKIYDDRDDAEPVTVKDLEVVDEDGLVTDPNIAGGVNRCAGAPVCDVPRPGGWHRIVRVPIDHVPEKNPIFLRTEIVAEPVYERPTSAARPIYFSRTLRVQLSPSPLPSLGASWRYFDVHMHTVAEWSLDTDLTAPRKAFGGPIQFIKETAYAMGLIEAEALFEPGQFKNHVIATDHNAFLSDNDRIGSGPTSGQPANFTYRPERFKEKNGQMEFELMRAAFGDTYGEEVTLQTDYRTDKPNFGSHLLMMRSDHYDGPWHGGRLGIDWLGKQIGLEENPNALDLVLADAAKAPLRFAYIAHPFASGNDWNSVRLEMLHDRSRRFVTPGSESKFVLKGAQYWNEKNDLTLAAEEGGRGAKVRKVDFFDLHPFPDEAKIRTPLPLEPSFEVRETYPRFKPDTAWDRDLQKGLIDWHTRIRRLLQFSFEDAPNEVFPRKIYLSGGSDAHGDFNFSTSLMATVLDNALVNALMPSQRSVTSNAFAKVRTYVNSEDKGGDTPEERALRALADGNSVATDGPVVTFYLDVDCRFDSKNLTWDENAKLPNTPKEAACNGFNKDGRIGGNGRYDTGWTALAVRGTHQAVVRYRWSNTSEFGAPYGGGAREIRLYVDTPDAGEPQVRQEKRTGVQPPVAVLVSTVTLTSVAAANVDGFEYLTRMNVPEMKGPMALSLGIFADRQASDRTESFSGYTNPIWVSSVSITYEAEKVEVIPAGSLKILFSFDGSMTPEPFDVALLPLDREGKGGAVRIPLQPDSGFGASGWEKGTAAGKPVRNALYRVTNATPVDTSQSKLKGKFVVYIKDPKDINGNILNSVADTVTLGLE